MAKKILTVVLLVILVVGLVIVMAPAYLDRAAHWDMFVSRLNYFIPGFLLMIVGAIGLTTLDGK